MRPHPRSSGCVLHQAFKVKNYLKKSHLKVCKHNLDQGVTKRFWTRQIMVGILIPFFQIRN